MKILFADDNYISREIAKDLDKENDTYLITSNGTEILEKIEEGIEKGEHYDLIFLFDILKDMEGADILKKIRALESAKGVSLAESSVITMFTSHSEGSFFLSALYVNCDYFLQLPVNHLKLETIIKTTRDDLGLKLPRSA